MSGDDISPAIVRELHAGGNVPQRTRRTRHAAEPAPPGRIDRHGFLVGTTRAIASSTSTRGHPGRLASGANRRYDRTMPKDGLNDDGGCAVDWSWLQGEEIAEVRSSLDSITFTFKSGRAFTVTARLWKGAPFVAFDPWEAPG